MDALFTVKEAFKSVSDTDHTYSGYRERNRELEKTLGKSLAVFVISQSSD